MGHTKVGTHKTKEDRRHMMERIQEESLTQKSQEYPKIQNRLTEAQVNSSEAGTSSHGRISL
jgi:hypothetical protein